MTSVSRITVSVADLDRALALYERVLGLERAYAMPGLVMLRAGDVEVLLHERAPSPSDAGVAASFRVAHVDAATDAAVAAGATVLDAPSDQPWGERQSVLRDADGHILCLVTPLRNASAP